ncbi:response regulator transcription factor [Tumidithrix helvetica PCC 7403]|uniref:response regulator transcription factor n=1 Tax=Tumidithrix helvetica TaxID=3457545 RepID=UPI003C9BE21F
MRMLLVEDDVTLAETLAESLEDYNYKVDIAEDGEVAWEKVQSTDYDIMLLDVMLPKLDGVRLCRRLRSHNFDLPILMITALSSSSEQITGLDAGADDYVVKPIQILELLARIRALLRRSKPPSTTPSLKWGDLLLDIDAYEVTYKDQPVHLTVKEQGILELLLRHGRQVVRRSLLVEKVWSPHKPPKEETINATIKSLRSKLKDASAPADFIETIHGVGYRLKQHS